MRRFLLILSAFLTLASASAADDVYLNRGVVTNVNVDAFSFINQGRFLIESIDIPWESQNTLDFRNEGEMFGYVGWDFLTITPEGDRFPARSFINTATGRIDAFANSSFFVFFGTGANFVFGTENSFLMVDSDTITNRGRLAVDSTGLIQIKGKSVDLSSSVVVVDPGLNDNLGAGLGFGFTDIFFNGTNFIGDPGVFDRAWGLGNITNVDQTSMAAGSFFGTPFFNITNKFFDCGDSLILTNPATFVRLNFPTPTNATIEVVAVSVPDTNINVDVRFVPFILPNGQSGQDDYTAATVQLSTTTTNAFDSRTNALQTLYVIDQTGASTNNNLLQNLTTPGFRPGPIIVTKFLPFFWDSGFSSNFTFSPGLFDDPGYTNTIVTNLYAAYAAEISSLANPLPFLPDVGPSNASGRVEIQADQLDLRNTRIRAEGLVSIQATNFISAQKAIVDSASLNYDLTVPAPRQSLKFEALAPEFAQRFGGNIVVYGSAWTNILTSADTNIPPTEVHFHVTVVDASQMHTFERALVHQLNLKSPSTIEINDRITVDEQFTIDSPSLTINGAFTLRQGQKWDSSKFRNLQFLTNHGELNIADVAQFESAPSKPLGALVNTGEINAFSHTINTAYFENRGLIIATNHFEEKFTNFCFATVFTFTNSEPSVGPIEVNSPEMLMNGGTLATAGSITFNGAVLKLLDSVNSAGGHIALNVTDTLTDAGPDNANRWFVSDGFSMGTPAPIGNLLGTWITSSADPFAIVEHSWSAQDRGATVAGYENNLALGRLSLAGSTNSVFEFTGTGSQNALYVDLLEISGTQSSSLNELTNSIVLADNINIYYADIRSTNVNITAETINGLTFGGGKMFWVPSFVGPNTSVDVALRDGTSIRVNRALRFSTRIDSDADGIANAFDPFPFDTVTVQQVRLSVAEGEAWKISFFAAPNTIYTVQYTDSLTDMRWQTLTTVKNTANNIQQMSVQDPAKNSQQRFYRISYTP
jgi:hypothetical protein